MSGTAPGFEGPLRTTSSTPTTGGGPSARAGGGDLLEKIRRNPKAALAVAGVGVAGVAYVMAQEKGPGREKGGKGSARRYELDTRVTDVYNELQPELENIGDRLEDLEKHKRPRPKKARRRYYRWWLRWYRRHEDDRKPKGPRRNDGKDDTPGNVGGPIRRDRPRPPHHPHEGHHTRPSEPHRGPRPGPLKDRPRPAVPRARDDDPRDGRGQPTQRRDRRATPSRG